MNNIKKMLVNLICPEVLLDRISVDEFHQLTAGFPAFASDTSIFPSRDKSYDTLKKIEHHPKVKLLFVLVEYWENAGDEKFPVSSTAMIISSMPKKEIKLFAASWECIFFRISVWWWKLFSTQKIESGNYCYILKWE